MTNDNRSERADAWQETQETTLMDAIASLEGLEEVRRFMRDLCTLSELQAMEHRWQAAQPDRGYRRDQ